MRRELAISLAALLAAAVLAPTAQAKQKERFFQDLNVTGPYPGQIYLTVIYKDKHGNGNFTPRIATAYRLTAQVSCNPGGASQLDMTRNATNPYGYFKQKLSNGRFSTRLEAAIEPQVPTPKGDLNGRVLRRVKKGNRVKQTARVEGAFDVQDWDQTYPTPGVFENCVSSGSYTATPCKSQDPKLKDWDVPVCRHIASD